ncbi:protein kinase [Leucobacter viscericola]|uniref:non-specific serine/threonine protein kinase n=1 Tax=Leucobacter viscericola TaxID=2714935 RepID=A0A6G7XET0_9MICO|nr:serine/threonine-protein kinase [Leucobacter viscericola]QIK62949.1 protein kinase [Leucobacter viscericola]
MSQPHAGAALGASYRLVDRIGSGAAGDVWLAESTADKTSFAAKILKTEHASDPELVERFIRERSVLIGLRHQNIVAVQDLVVEGSTLAIVMDYVPGGSLRDLLADGGPIPAAEAMTLCAQVLDALAVAHGRGVTHRDIKPDNVLLSEQWQPGQNGTVRVTDFGIASVVSERQRQTTGILGTPQYMAPELISHGQTSPAADVYSTGVMLYELLAGRTPFAGPGTDFTIAYRHVTSLPPRLEVPEKLWAAVNRLLAKDPRERLGAGDAAAELRNLAAQFASLTALTAAPVTESFEEIERPATMLRSDLIREAEEIPDHVSHFSQDLPELGDAGQHTVIRAMPKREIPRSAALVEEPEKGKYPDWLTKKVVLLAGSGLVLVIALVIGMVWMFEGGSEPSEAVATETLDASQQDQILPTGLSTSRKASFDPETRLVTVEMTYGAQKSELSGAFLEVIPGMSKKSACPAVEWDGAKVSKHQTSTTGLNVTCGWKLDGLVVPANGQKTVTAKFPFAVADASELSEWLSGAASATTAAITDPDAISTAYPSQRLTNINVVTPQRLVSQTPVTVTLVPVWPSGADELNPLYQSPSTGTPSQMLQQVAGGEAGVRFSDSCSGAIAISSDGLVVTALSVTPSCSLRASVGNFTDLMSSPFSITTRE